MLVADVFVPPGRLSIREHRHPSVAEILELRRGHLDLRVGAATASRHADLASAQRGKRSGLSVKSPSTPCSPTKRRMSAIAAARPASPLPAACRNV